MEKAENLYSNDNWPMNLDRITLSQNSSHGFAQQEKDQ